MVLQAGVPPARQAPPARPVLKVPPPAAPAQQPVAASSSAAAAPSVPQPAKPHLQQPAAAVPPAAAALPQQHAAPAVPPHPEQVEEAPEAVSVAVGQLASEPAGAAAAEVLAKLLGNIVAAPADPKFRRVRLTNPRIQSAVVDVGGGLELLLACGFEIVFEEAAPPAGAAAAGSSGGDAGEAAAEASSEGYAVLAEGADLEPLRQALRLLAGLLPSAPAGARPAAAPPASRPVTDAPRPAQQQPAQQQQRPGRPPREWEAARERNTQASCLASWVEEEGSRHRLDAPISASRAARPLTSGSLALTLSPNTRPALPPPAAACRWCCPRRWSATCPTGSSSAPVWSSRQPSCRHHGGGSRTRHAHCRLPVTSPRSGLAWQSCAGVLDGVAALLPCLIRPCALPAGEGSEHACSLSNAVPPPPPRPPLLWQVLMTRAMRERLRGGPGRAAATHATLKVRFPEGISLQVGAAARRLPCASRCCPASHRSCSLPAAAAHCLPARLQGEFGAGEPVAAVFAWVADCLSDPLHTYELVLPSRQPLEAKAQSGGWPAGLAGRCSRGCRSGGCGRGFRHAVAALPAAPALAAGTLPAQLR